MLNIKTILSNHPLIICTCNDLIIEAYLTFLKEEQAAIVLADSKAVDQFGGQSGLNPGDFVDFVVNIAEDCSFHTDRLFIGGYRLGLLPFVNEIESLAMENACGLVESAARAGYTFFHIDATKPLLDETDLAPQVIAKRTFTLLRTLCEHGDVSNIAVSLKGYNDSVLRQAYESALPATMRALIVDSRSYSLVGTGLNKALRQVLLALGCIEEELLGSGFTTSGIGEMLNKDPNDLDVSFDTAIDELILNLNGVDIPEELILKFLPCLSERICSGEVAKKAYNIIAAHLQDALRGGA